MINYVSREDVKVTRECQGVLTPEDWVSVAGRGKNWAWAGVKSAVSGRGDDGAGRRACKMAWGLVGDVVRTADDVALTNA